MFIAWLRCRLGSIHLSLDEWSIMYALRYGFFIKLVILVDLGINCYLGKLEYK